MPVSVDISRFLSTRGVAPARWLCPRPRRHKSQSTQQPCHQVARHCPSHLESSAETPRASFVAGFACSHPRVFLAGHQKPHRTGGQAGCITSFSVGIYGGCSFLVTIALLALFDGYHSGCYCSRGPWGIGHGGCRVEGLDESDDIVGQDGIIFWYFESFCIIVGGGTVSHQ